MRLLKKMFVVVLMLSIPAWTSLAQVDKGDKELSAAASFESCRWSDSDYSESFTSFRLAGRLGYFFTKNVEIEPEITIGKISEDIFDDENKMAYILSCNLAYNFTPDSKSVPFVLAGFGLANTIPYLHDVVIWGSEDETLTIINAGMGIKLFIGKNVAVRLEYRFQHYFGGEDIGDYNFHFGLVGFSVFLN